MVINMRGPVTGDMIADGAVTTAKLEEKARPSVVAAHDQEISQLGTTSDPAKDKQVRVSVHTGKKILPNKFVFTAELKTDNASHAAKMDIHVDGSGTPEKTLTSTSTDYELVSDEIDVGPNGLNLSDGTHLLCCKLYSADASATASNRQLEIFQIKQ